MKGFTNAFARSNAESVRARKSFFIAERKVVFLGGRAVRELGQKEWPTLSGRAYMSH